MQPGWAIAWMNGGANGKAAALQFLAALASGSDETKFEIGLMWDMEHKWRVYERYGEAFYAMPPDEARRLHRIYQKEAQKPEWRGKDIGVVMEMFRELPKLATEAFQKNQRGDVPPDGVQFMPSQGRA